MALGTSLLSVLRWDIYKDILNISKICFCHVIDIDPKHMAGHRELANTCLRIAKKLNDLPHFEMAGKSRFFFAKYLEIP